MAFYVEIIKTGKEEGNFIYYNYLFFLPIDKYKSASGKTRYKSKEVKWC